MIKQQPVDSVCEGEGVEVFKKKKISLTFGRFEGPYTLKFTGCLLHVWVYGGMRKRLCWFCIKYFFKFSIYTRKYFWVQLKHVHTHTTISTGFYLRHQPVDNVQLNMFTHTPQYLLVSILDTNQLIMYVEARCVGGGRQGV